MDIAGWREKIDSLDEQITDLLNQRAAAAVAIGEIKQREGARIYEPGREQQVFDHVRAVNPGPLTGGQLQDVYVRIMDIMRSLQRPDRGVAPSATHEAGATAPRQASAS